MSISVKIGRSKSHPICLSASVRYVDGGLTGILNVRPLRTKLVTATSIADVREQNVHSIERPQIVVADCSPQSLERKSFTIVHVSLIGAPLVSAIG